ncbi:hypothetical protein H7F15_08745 [Pontibacter sp. Tf4]|nr:hypothetical protein [Pontibacter sp. Tf4]MBB6611121.1 hypothetical protein [Pontibacter sp. Tf4]
MKSGYERKGLVPAVGKVNYRTIAYRTIGHIRSFGFAQDDKEATIG